MRLFFIVISVMILLFSSCVPSRKFEEMRLAKEYWEREADAADSLTQNILRLEDELKADNLQLLDTYRDIESLEAANRNLRRSYQELLDRYNRIIEQSQAVVSTSSFERQQLTESLAQKQNLLDQKERELRQIEGMLKQREDRLNQTQGDMNNMQNELYEREKRINQLSTQISQDGQRMNQLKFSFDNQLNDYRSDLDVSDRAGKVYVALSERLLFKSGSDVIEAGGKRVIKEIAKTLNDPVNADLSVIVEGHTDADGSELANWDLSVRRATAVVKELVQNNVSPNRITASGRGMHQPIFPNTTATNKAKNRRVEIILSPNYDNLIGNLRR
jgi:chemotaxis protein MotB